MIDFGSDGALIGACLVGHDVLPGWDLGYVKIGIELGCTECDDVIILNS